MHVSPDPTRLLPPGTAVRELLPAGAIADADTLWVRDAGAWPDPGALVATARRATAPEALLVVSAGGPGPRALRHLARVGRALEADGWSVVERRAALPWPATGGVASAPRLAALFGAAPYLMARRPAPRPGLTCSVVIPCHDEQDNVAACVTRVPDMGAGTEILVCDDGSRDRTREVAVALMAREPRLRVIATDRNQGKAAAVRAGFAAATGDVVMILDADMTVPPETLPRFFAPLANGTADFVNGTRLEQPMADGAMPLVNLLGNHAFAGLTGLILGQRITDSLCGTKAMLRRDYARMPLGGRERWGDFDLLFGAGCLRHRIREVDVRYEERTAGASKMRSSVEGVRFLRACWTGWAMLRRPDPRRAPRPGGLPDGWRELPRLA